MDDKKIISIEDRIPKLKEARKKKANKRLVFYLSILFILLAVIIYLQSALSDVKHVIVEGNTLLSTEEITTALQLDKKTNIWEVNNRSFKKELMDNPLIKEVKITRKLPRSVEVVITEHHLVGYVTDDDKLQAILPDGELINLTNETFNIANGPIVKGFENEKHLADMANELVKTDEEVFHLISEIIWQAEDKDQGKVLLYMNDGFIVDTTIRQFADNMEEYPAIVAQIEEGEQGIIHMGVGTYFESTK